MFKKAYVEISDVCGLTCSFCPAPKGRRGLMDLGLFEKICFELRGRCERMALHILGDPLKNKKLLQYLSIASKFQHKIEIVTSGYYLSLWDFETLLSSPIEQVNLSLSAYTDQNNPKFENYLQNCLDFAHFHQKLSSSCFLNLRMHKSRLDLELAKKICQSFGVKCEFIGSRVRLGRYLFLRLSKDFEWIDRSSKQLNEQKSCYGLLHQIGFLSNGKVVPCCIDCDGVIELGDIVRQSLDEILSSSLSQNIIRGFRMNRAYHPHCQRCTYVSKKDMD